MNEWGIPDWRDPAAYGDTSTWTFMRWRWEFYRRREDLRAYFDEHAREPYFQYDNIYLDELPKKPTGRMLMPDEPGYVAPVDSETADKLGYAGIPNPRISDQPSRVLFSMLDYPGDVSLYDGARCKTVTGEPTGPKLEEGQYAVVFNLNKPLTEQVAAAKRELENAQVRRHGKKLQRRRSELNPARRKDLWLRYLRVLDARECGLKPAEIARAILPCRGTDDEVAQVGRDALKAADRLRFNF